MEVKTEMNWQPIGTAPRDGTRILLTDGVLMAAGHLASRVEDALMIRGGLSAEGMLLPGFMDYIPNPNVGKRHEWWSTSGCTAFSVDTDVADDGGPLSFEPTHWMPLPEPPRQRRS